MNVSYPKIIKRDGRVVDFDTARIHRAISKAAHSIDVHDAYSDIRIVVDKVLAELEGLSEVSIDQVQETVENALIDSQLKKVARAYIGYRRERDIARDRQSALISEVEGLINRKDKSLLNENANKDSKLLPTQRDLLAGIISRHYAKHHYLPEDIANAHDRGDIHYHDLDYSPFLPYFNCFLVDLRGMLERGFRMGNAEIETPKSISTACAITAQIVAQVASHTYGGTTLNRLDEVLAPYVVASYNKHIQVGKRYGIKNVKAYAEERTTKECTDAFQALEYEINTLHTANGQTPFVTFGFGLGTDWASKLVQQSILNTRLAGLGKHHKTAVFPKLVYSIKDGVNHKADDPNYDVKQLALECASKRIYPDILNYDRLVEVTGSFKAPMGCVDGQEVIMYIYKGVVYCDNFKTLWDRVTSEGKIELQGISEFVRTNDLYIHDVDNTFAKVMLVLRNPDQGNWRQVKFSNGRCLVCTGDHPLPVEGKGRTFVDDMEHGDKVALATKTPVVNISSSEERNAWLEGLLMCDASFVDNIRISLGSDEDDIVARAVASLEDQYPENTVSVIKQERGERGNYTDILVKGTGSGVMCKELQSLFRGRKKEDRLIPEYIFSAPFDVRFAFLAGMVDADGYLHENGVVHIGSTNKSFALQQAYLFSSVGMEPKIYMNRYSSKSNGIRYRVECKVIPELTSKMASEKKIQNVKRNFKNWKNQVGEVVEITDLGSRGEYSYDVTTESDTFVVSGIHSHNCRSFLSKWTDEQGNEVHDGRNNLGVVSLNLPRIAILAQGDEDAFNRILDERLELAHRALRTRIDRLEHTKASVAPILYIEGACGVRLKPDDNIADIFKHGRASISLGYIGIHETVKALYGADSDLFTDKELQDKAVAIVRRLRTACDTWKTEEGYGYSLYSTPSENLCDRFCRLDTEAFGKIKGVTDKGYYTNSFHLDVERKTDPYTKILFEEAYPEIANGGFISYGEFPNLQHNLKAIEDVWDFAYKHIPYYGTNMPVDECYECNYQGEFTASNKGYSCPKCGNNDPKKTSVIRRVCGYLGNCDARPFNEGKQQEVMRRVKHVNGPVTPAGLEDL